MNDQEAFGKAIELWGPDFQLDMTVEECAELIYALCKFKRRRIGESFVIEEMADVAIMLSQLRLIFDPKDMLFQPVYDAKMARLKTLIERDIHPNEREKVKA